MPTAKTPPHLSRTPDLMRIEWTRKAAGDLALVVEFLRERNPAAAERAQAAIFSAIDQLNTFPESGRRYARDPSFRELLVPFGSRGYVILYRVYAEAVLISAVRHQRQSDY